MRFESADSSKFSGYKNNFISSKLNAEHFTTPAPCVHIVFFAKGFAIPSVFDTKVNRCIPFELARNFNYCLCDEPHGTICIRRRRWTLSWDI